MRRFMRGCHYGWDLAQRQIGHLVVEYEESRRLLRSELKASRRNRDNLAIERCRTLIDCLESRQIVLRRLADTILYHLFSMQTWIPRHIMTEYRIRDIDPRVVKDTLQVATMLNAENRTSFHLVADLTTVVHVGDLVRIRPYEQSKKWDLIELKHGRMNSILQGKLQAPEISDETKLNEIREQYGAKAAVQAKRMAKQQSRHDEFMRLVETDKGIDILHNVPVNFVPESVEVLIYDDKLRDICLSARSTGLEVCVVGGCLRLIALGSKLQQLFSRSGIAHLLYHMQFGIKECVLTQTPEQEISKLDSIFPFFDLVRMNLRAMWPPPLFLWPLPRDLVIDLLFGRVSVYAQLDFDRLFERAEAKGMEMRWATDEEIGLHSIAKRIPGSPNAKGIKVNLKGAPEPCQIILGGFLARMFVEFMSPNQFLELVREGPWRARPGSASLQRP